MRRMEAQFLQSKFRGALLGALMGDCLGAPFEGDKFDKGQKLTLTNYFEKLEGPMFKTPVKQYTDDTAMTKSILDVLIRNKAINQKELARKFVVEYFSDRNRGYGEAVVDVFDKLRRTKCENPTEPAYEQFGGSGSYGNGAAMRVCPIALFCHDKPLELLRTNTRQAAEITHSNKLGIDGAILQSIAIHQSLSMDPKEPFDPRKFIEELIAKMEKVEKDDEIAGIKLEMPYHKQLKKIIYFLENPERAHDTGVIESLGNDVTALKSVPTAIYAFVRAQTEIDDIGTKNPFRRTIHYAISLGGDTDTIASMAGAIAGAYHGDELISKNLMQHCESFDEIINAANRLYEVSI